MSQEKTGNVSMENIFRLDGRVPVAKAIPFGLQHVLAMFVSNLAPITIIAGAAQPALSQQEIASLIQNAMFVAGIATMIQLFPVWKVGAKLPIVMGVSFTFVTILSTIAANYGYPTVIGAVLIGGIFEGTLGLLAKYWKKMISPIVSATVVTSIGLSLFTVGARSFGSPRALFPFRKFYPICRSLILVPLFPCVSSSWYRQRKLSVTPRQWLFPDWIGILPRKKSPGHWLVTAMRPPSPPSSDVRRLPPSLRLSVLLP